MTLQEFTRDINPLVQTCIYAVGLCSLILVFFQLRQTKKWNRFHTTYSLFSIDRAERLEKSVADCCLKHGVSINKDFAEEHTQKLFHDKEAVLALKTFLDDQEILCVAYRAGLLDSDLSYAIHSARVLKTYGRLKPVITEFRSRANDDEVYVEIEKVAIEWAARDRKEAAKKRKITEKAAKQLARLKGVGKKA